MGSPQHQFIKGTHHPMCCSQEEHRAEWKLEILLQIFYDIWSSCKHFQRKKKKTLIFIKLAFCNTQMFYGLQQKTYSGFEVQFFVVLEEREKERETFHLLVHSPNSPAVESGPRWRQELETASWSLHMDGRSLRIWCLFCFFPRNINRKVDQKWIN